MLYFDGNANHPIDNTVVKSYYEGCKFNNISSFEPDEVKKIIAELVIYLRNYYGDYEIIFTSGGSESNSTVIYQFLYSGYSKFNCPITSHSSTTDYLKRLEKDGKAVVNWLVPDSTGNLKLDNLPLANCTFIQSVDSETGVIHDYSKIKGVIAVDDTQGFMKHKIPKNSADYISISFHKIGAPIGCGALLFKKPIISMIAGKQNGGMRGGTYNIGCIAASLCAVKNYKYDGTSANKFWSMAASRFHVYRYDDFIKVSKNNKLPDLYFVHINHAENTMGHVIFGAIGKGNKIMCGNSVKSDLLAKGILIGTGSACNSKSKSDVGSMNAVDIHPAVKTGFIRITFINSKNIDKLVASIIELYG